MESRLEKIFSIGINSMSLAVWLGEDRKCSAAVVGLDLLLGLSMVRRCSLNLMNLTYYACAVFNWVLSITNDKNLRIGHIRIPGIRLELACN